MYMEMGVYRHQWSMTTCLILYVVSLLMYIPKHKNFDRVLGLVSEIIAQV